MILQIWLWLPVQGIYKQKWSTIVADFHFSSFELSCLASKTSPTEVKPDKTVDE